jgi:hypothetical protein
VNARTNIAALASALEALGNCERSGNTEWATKHEATIDRIMGEAPSGSGIDNGTVLDDDTTSASGGKRIVFNVAFHRMNEHGGYDGWRNYRVTIRPTFDGIDVAVTGRGDETTKDYLADVYRCWAQGGAS